MTADTYGSAPQVEHAAISPAIPPSTHVTSRQPSCRRLLRACREGSADMPRVLVPHSQRDLLPVTYHDLGLIQCHQ